MHTNIESRPPGCCFVVSLLTGKFEKVQLLSLRRVPYRPPQGQGGVGLIVLIDLSDQRRVIGVVASWIERLVYVAVPVTCTVERVELSQLKPCPPDLGLLWDFCCLLPLADRDGDDGWRFMA